MADETHGGVRRPDLLGRERLRNLVGSGREDAGGGGGRNSGYGGTDGFALAQWVRRRRPGLEVLLAGTVAREADIAGELCDQGPHLARPHEPQAVVDRIRRLLARRRR